MNYRKTWLAAAIIIAAAGIVSCKDDDDDTISLPYLDGTPSFELPRYVTAGTEMTLTAEEVTNPTGAEITYKWDVTRGSDEMLDDEETETDGGRTLSLKFSASDGKDTLCNFTVTCATEATGYYGTSYTAVTTAVNGNSLKHADFEFGEGIHGGKVTDQRTGDEYNTVVINGREWTAENMHYGLEEPKTGVALEEADAVSGIFGRYYKWEDAVSVCEGLGEGWALPSHSDWDALCTALGAGSQEGGNITEDGLTAKWEGVTGSLMSDATFNLDKMWEYWTAVGDLTNESGLSVIPAGYATVMDNGSSDIYTFDGFGEYAGFWTSTEHSTGSSAYYVYFWDKYPDMRLGYVDKKSFALPVRCVRSVQP